MLTVRLSEAPRGPRRPNSVAGPCAQCLLNTPRREDPGNERPLERRFSFFQATITEPPSDFVLAVKAQTGNNH
jgi:hypothetical protein